MVPASSSSWFSGENELCVNSTHIGQGALWAIKRGAECLEIT